MSEPKKRRPAFPLKVFPLIAGVNIERNAMLKLWLESEGGNNKVFVEYKYSKLDPPEWVFGYANRALKRGEEIWPDDVDWRPGRRRGPMKSVNATHIGWRRVGGSHGGSKTHWVNTTVVGPDASDSKAYPIARFVKNNPLRCAPSTTPPKDTDTDGWLLCPSCSARLRATMKSNPRVARFFCEPGCPSRYWYVLPSDAEWSLRFMHARQIRRQMKQVFTAIARRRVRIALKKEV